jgi:2-polyprenyl-3-methyl-5-hydroxy-6-metoxy-1,4-benzoquinol methylase
MIEQPLCTETVACDCCGSLTAQPFQSLHDCLFSVPGTFNLMQCTSCGLTFLNPRPDAATLIRLYQTYYAAPGGLHGGQQAARLRRHFWLRSLYHRVTGEYLSAIIARSSGKVLDVGCGSGFLLDDLRTAGRTACGVELNRQEADAAAAKGFEVFCGPLEQAGFPDASFDTVILNHVLEHVPSPSATLREIYRLLAPGGILLLHTPNLSSYQRRIFGPCWAGWHLPFHLYQFTPATLANLARAAGFTVRRTMTVSPEYHFLTSAAAHTRAKNGTRLPGIVRSLPARLVLSLALRICDFLLPGRGDGLRIEVSKGN